MRHYGFWLPYLTHVTVYGKYHDTRIMHYQALILSTIFSFTDENNLSKALVMKIINVLKSFKKTLNKIGLQ